MTPIRCQSCGKENPGGRFCRGCGRPLAASAPAPVPASPSPHPAAPSVPAPAPVAGPAAAAPAAPSPFPVVAGDGLHCPRGHWLAAPNPVCERCMRGEPVLPPAEGGAAAGGRPLRALAWFGGLVVFAWLFRGPFSSGFGTLLLICAAGGLFIWLRRDLRAALSALESLPALQPLLKTVAQVPRPLRMVGAVLAPFVISFILNDWVSMVWGGFGFLIALTLIAINVVFADLLLWEPPGGARR